MQQPFGVKALAHASRRVSELPVPVPTRWRTALRKPLNREHHHDHRKTYVSANPAGVHQHDCI